jgi:hypothetical protein
MKRRQKAALKPRNIILAITACLVMGLAGVGYVWAKGQVHDLGREIKGREMRLDELRRTNALLRQAYATLCSPRELDAAARRLNLGLAAPRPDQIVRMEEPAPRPEKSYAARVR